MPPEVSEEELDRYTRALCLHMFGTIMFPDMAQNCVPVYYLDLIDGSLNEERKINWGGVVIASLYRVLDRAVLKFKKPSGPWLLLLYWTWSYLPVCKPGEMESSANMNKKQSSWGGAMCKEFFGLDGSGQCQLAAIFRVLYIDATTCAGWHQQGLVQAIPPPLPIAWNTMYTLYNFNNGTFKKGADWNSVFGPLTAMWNEIVLRSRAESVDRRARSDTIQRNYARYMRETGAAEFPVSRAEAYARRRQQPISGRQYTPMTPRGKSALGTAMKAIGLLAKKGFRWVGKKILRNCRSQLENASMPFQLDDLLHNEGFSQNIDEIADSDTETSAPEDPMQPEEPVQPDEPVQRPEDPIQPHYTQIPASGPTPSQFQASGSTSTSHFAGMSYGPTGIFSSFMPQYPPYPPYTTFGQPSFSYGGAFPYPPYTSFSSQPAFGYDPVFSTDPQGTSSGIPSYSSPIGSMGGVDSFTTLLHTGMSLDGQYGSYDQGQEPKMHGDDC
ncbi:hypothetical protein LUZ63_006336 [Rhynchospora breviuscula]|uniref:Aminotransferase-like plant mobile domain-containing protein n=1 Tax=Rhynchospora breviuscula TaxID=2022672 RepID=A0A9Q0CPK4_9POAL|nr:hypothetical protein LUZ63_006336 [Rhynchospora breviuscula]